MQACNYKSFCQNWNLRQGKQLEDSLTPCGDKRITQIFQYWFLEKLKQVEQFVKQFKEHRSRCFDKSILKTMFHMRIKYLVQTLDRIAL